MKYTYSKKLCLPAYAVFLLLCYTVSADCGVTLKLSSYQELYVLHEPLQFTGTLINDSDSDIHIGGMEMFDKNMELLYLVIEYEDGSIDKRRTHYYSESALISPYYEGQTLKPGESYTFDIFPNRTFSIDNMKERDWTFPEPGLYRVKLVYAVDDFWKVLWKPEKDALYSNQITINVAPPTLAEREILEAYWLNLISDWDASALFFFDRALLERMISTYSSERLIKYLHFALLHNSFSPHSQNLQLAIKHARQLMYNYPDFRTGQVRKTLATYLLTVGRKNEALQMLDEALAIKPTLKDDYYFMHRKIYMETGNTGAFYEWKRKRNKDVKMKGYNAYEN